MTSYHFDFPSSKFKVIDKRKMINSLNVVLNVFKVSN